MRRATASDLLLVLKSQKEKLDAFSAGAHLVSRTGYDLPVLYAKAAHDRIALAKELLLDAKVAASNTPPMYRVAVSRAYYSMYHAIRALVFLEHGGDDFEQHTKLPAHIPQKFPDKLDWENVLKNARLERNRADYDPYPRNRDQFAEVSSRLIADATRLLPIVVSYLRTRE